MTLGEDSRFTASPGKTCKRIALARNFEAPRQASLLGAEDCQVPGPVMLGTTRSPACSRGIYRASSRCLQMAPGSRAIRQVVSRNFGRGNTPGFVAAVPAAPRRAR